MQEVVRVSLVEMGLVGELDGNLVLAHNKEEQVHLVVMTYEDEMRNANDDDGRDGQVEEGCTYDGQAKVEG